MIDIQSVLTYLTLISVPVGVFYHILTLWNAQKSRRTQILLELYQTMSNPENNRLLWEFLSMEWEDYDDFMEKYSPQTNPDHANKRQAFWSQYDGLGMLVKNNVVDIETVYRARGSHIIMIWFKFESIIRQLRVDEIKQIGEEYLMDLEFLAEKMIDIREKRGLPLPTQWLHPSSELYQQYNSQVTT
jgi:hypothetical protein